MSNIAFTERAAVTAAHGMVTCPHALASQAGVDALKKARPRLRVTR